MTCSICALRTRDHLGPCAGCGAIGIPFLDGYLNVPEQPAAWHTVPWCPEASIEQMTGRTLRALRLTAELAREHGWTAAALQARPHWREPSVRGALVRLAVRIGLIP